MNVHIAAGVYHEIFVRGRGPTGHLRSTTRPPLTTRQGSLTALYLYGCGWNIGVQIKQDKLVLSPPFAPSLPSIPHVVGKYTRLSTAVHSWRSDLMVMSLSGSWSLRHHGSSRLGGAQNTVEQNDSGIEFQSQHDIVVSGVRPRCEICALTSQPTRTN
ncbi:hypothetical protein J6590_027917 [Homalodisca vitripennis]|nr:hypothetical protein J6590_027917 [Homalodisca vitripennis]